jgi:hypothetical protein
VVTYKEAQPHPTWTCGRGAPSFGSQAPFHQRYQHYKYHGFAGVLPDCPLFCLCRFRPDTLGVGVLVYRDVWGCNL